MDAERIVEQHRTGLKPRQLAMFATFLLFFTANGTGALLPSLRETR